jgi:hypothetical protein
MVKSQFVVGSNYPDFPEITSTKQERLNCLSRWALVHLFALISCSMKHLSYTKLRFIVSLCKLVINLCKLVINFAFISVIDVDAVNPPEEILKGDIGR